MGTTRDAIRSGNPQLGFVLCIEGYKYLITDGDPTAVTTAWASTMWSNALSGLVINGTFEQGFEPWANELPIPRITFKVLPVDGADQFGIDMFKAKPTARSNLTVGFNAGDSSGGSFDITVQDADQFATADTVSIGTETFLITGTPAGNTISIAANGEGVFAPFSTDVGSSSRFPRPHNLPSDKAIGTLPVNESVVVTDKPTQWAGKMVGLFVHRIVDGVWDAKAEAECWFAGTIEDVTEDEGGATVIHCADIRKSLNDATLLPNQFSAKAKPGFYFQSGDVFYLAFATTTGFLEAADLTCVASGAGADEFNAGLYTADEIAEEIAAHVNADATIGTGAGYRWDVGTYASPEGLRFRVRVTRSSAALGYIYFGASRPEMFEFLGFNNKKTSKTEAATATEADSRFTDVHQVVGEKAPFAVQPVGSVRAGKSVSRISLMDTDGEFFDYTSLLPERAAAKVGAGEAWSYFLFNDETIFFGRVDSATSPTYITDISVPVGLTGEVVGQVENLSRGEGVRSDEFDGITIKQIAIMTDSFSSLMAKLFASVDGNGANHATYDVFPFGAGIPWEILGQSFLNSARALEQSLDEDSYSLILDRPTRLWDAIKADMTARFASVAWKSSGLQFVQLTVPNASEADHVLDETNKSDTRRTRIDVTRSYQAHTVKLLHNRMPGTDRYSATSIIRDTVAYENQGTSGGVKSIKLANCFSTAIDTGSNIDAIMELIGSRFLPVLAKPLKTWTRSITHNLFHIAPGDTVALTDDYVRSPTTGQRGINSRACTVLSTRHSFGVSSDGQGYFGEVVLIFTEEDRAFPLAPSMMHANYGSGGSPTYGWDGTNRRLIVEQRKYSSSPHGFDSSHFSDGDAVRITELDPADPAAPETFTDTINGDPVEGFNSVSAVDYDAIVLTNGFGVGGRPAFDNSKTYIVELDDYDQQSAAQKLHSFQADDADGYIQDEIEPNLYCDKLDTVNEVYDLTELPARHANNMYGDGKPVSAHLLKHLSDLVNNINNYRTATCIPMLVDDFGSIIGLTGSSGVMRSTITFAAKIGRGPMARDTYRPFNCRIGFFSSGGTPTFRITSSDAPPSNNTFLDARFPGTSRSIEWTTASGAFAYSSSQELTPVRATLEPAITFLTLELDDTAQCRGIAELWQGPVTE